MRKLLQRLLFKNELLELSRLQGEVESLKQRITIETSKNNRLIGTLNDFQYELKMKESESHKLISQNEVVVENKVNEQAEAFKIAAQVLQKENKSLKEDNVNLSKKNESLSTKVEHLHKLIEAADRKIKRMSKVKK